MTMPRSMSIAVLAAALAGPASLAQAPGQLPPRDGSAQGAPRATPSGRISGRVLAADGGRVVRRAVVRVTAPELPGGRAVVTDEAGAFDFPALPPGRYLVSAARVGFVSLSYGQRRPLQPGTPLQLGDGQHLRGVDFRLPRGSAIAGRVFDEDGEPMAAANVRVMRLQLLDGNRQLVQSGGGQTDDRGQYRVWGLMPGEYYVSAVARPVGGGRGGPGAPPPTGGRGRGTARGSLVPIEDQEIGYAPTFYPGVMSAAEARAVNVGLGAEALDIDFSVMAVRTSTIAGRVVVAENGELGRGTVTLFSEGAVRGGPGLAYQRPIGTDGSFAITQIPPGRYTLRAQLGRGTPAFGMQPLTVTGDGDLTNLTVPVAPGGTLSGRLVFSGVGTAGDLRQFRITTAPAEPFGFAPPGTARVEPDGAFTVEGVPAGLRRLRAQAPRGWALQSAIADGRDVIDEPFDVRPGQRISGLTLTFTDQLSEINGTVSTGPGWPVSEFTVLAFATDPARWRPGSRHILTARPDQNGKYQLRGLPGGDYYVALIDPAEPGQWFDPAYLEEQVASAARVRLTDGGTRTQDITVKTR